MFKAEFALFHFGATQRMNDAFILRVQRKQSGTV